MTGSTTPDFDSVTVDSTITTTGNNPILSVASASIGYNTAPVGASWLISQSYSTSYNTWGNIFQIASEARSTSTAPVVALYASGIGNGPGAAVWGANIAAVVANAGATGIGIEVDINMPAAGTGYGIAIDAVGANQATSALQVQSNTIAGGFQYGLHFNNTGRTAVSGSLIDSLGSSASYGINFSGSFSSAELSLPSFVVGPTPGGLNAAVQINGSASGLPSIAAVGAAANASLVIAAKNSAIQFLTGSTTGPVQFYVAHSAGATSYMTATGGSAGVVLGVDGSDTNAAFFINAKGTGTVVIATATVTQLNLTTTAGPNIRSGTGAASGTQPKGSLWMRTDGGVGTTMYVSQGAGVWNAVAAV